MTSDDGSIYQFVDEIQRMMFSFGDCTRPSVESANLIERVVQQCLVKMVYKLEEICKFRESKDISIEDFLYLFRKDRIKLIRIIHFLKNKDLREKANKWCYTEEESDATCNKKQAKRRLKICHDFLSSIDTTGSLISLLENDVEDELMRQRRIRLEKLTRQLTTQQYLEFSKARQIDFSTEKKMQKFKGWLFSKLTDLEVKVNKHAYEILSYLVFEAVGEIVEASLMVRRDGEARGEDPLILYSTTTSSNHDQLFNAPPKSSIQSSEDGEVKVSRSTQDHDTPSLIERTAISTAEIREALRRLSQFSTPFSDINKSVTPFLSQQSWFYV